MEACGNWQSSYKDDEARVIFDNIARGVGHALWLQRFSLDIWEDCSSGRVLQPRELWHLHPWRLARPQLPCVGTGASPAPGGRWQGPRVLLWWPPCRPASGSHSMGRSSHTRPALPLTAVGELLPPGPDTSLSLSCQLSEGKMMERRKKIALELSELVVYCRPVPFDEESEHLLVWCLLQAVTVVLQTARCAPRCCFG